MFWKHTAMTSKKMMTVFSTQIRVLSSRVKSPTPSAFFEGILPALDTYVWVTCLCFVLLLSSLQLTQPKMKRWIFRSHMFISWKLSETGGLGDRVCEPKQRRSPPGAQTKPQSAQHFRPYAAYELAPEFCLARFLWMLLKIKRAKKKAQPQRAKSYTQPSWTICWREIDASKKFLYMHSLSAVFSSSSSLK